MTLFPPEDEQCPEIPTTPQISPTNETAVLALGWFWTPQYKYSRILGVVSTVVGYSGGQEKNPTYDRIKDATESILIEYNPDIISFEDILAEWSKMHAPFRKRHSQYRSAIFYINEKQKKIAKDTVEAMKNKTGEEIFTDVELVSAFYRAEEYHQDYIKKEGGY